MERSHDLIGSWIIVGKATDKPLIELFSPANLAQVNTEKYQVYTAEEWLIHFNRSVRN